MKTIVISTQKELDAFNGNFEGNLDLRGWKDFDLDLQGATVAGDLNFQEATIRGYLNLKGAAVGGCIYLEGATVGGSLNLQGTTAARRLNLQDAKIVGNLYLQDAKIVGSLNLQDATVGNIWYPTPTKEEADFLARVLSKNNFDMEEFHSNDLWKKDTQTCGTTHCIRGWAEVEFLEKHSKECEDKNELYPNLKWLFYLDNETARAYMEKIIAKFN